MARALKVPADKDLRRLLPFNWVDLPRNCGEVHAILGVPSAGSYGDFLISRHFYRIQDRRRWLKQNDVDSDVYMRARKLFLRQCRKRGNGKLYCENCKKGPLKADAGNVFSSLPMATVDHQIPLSKDGLRFDFNNMACYCERCNQNKKDKSI